MASTPSSTVAPIAHGQGTLLTLRPHLANALFSWLGPLSWAAAAFRSERARILYPVDAISAGTRVSAEIIVTTTTSAAAAPIAPTNGTPDRYSPRIAMTTVLPATTIAAPEVEAARPMESTMPMPA